ncbi:MAG: hypothetical protein WAL55_07410 [Candidatus Acidiferrales bacterium]
MAKRKTEDVNEAAFRVVRESTASPIPINRAKRRKNPAAVALGRIGGKKSGKARMEKLTPEQRHQLASKAARARWHKEPETT